jgi:hypothetical protein
MRFSSFVLAGVVVAAACGGTTSSGDGGVDGGSDGTVGDSGSNGDTGPHDSGIDVIPVDAAECTPPNTTCQSPCPQGTICLKVSGPQEHDYGCTTIPPECNGTASCACMADCFCPQNDTNQCVPGQGYLECMNGAISRRELKTDIAYVDDAERALLADEALHTRLAEYRYKTDPESSQRHLGFIIDDMPNASRAVQADKTHVDLYGYTSMLLATVQEQQKQIDELKKQVAAAKRK